MKKTSYSCKHRLERLIWSSVALSHCYDTFFLFKKMLSGDLSLHLYFYLFFNMQTVSCTEDGVEGTASILPASAIGHGKTPPCIWMSTISSNTHMRTLMCNCCRSTCHIPTGCGGRVQYPWWDVCWAPRGSLQNHVQQCKPIITRSGRNYCPLVTADPRVPYDALQASGKDCF